MTISMRTLIRIVEGRLDELVTTGSANLPPVIDRDRGEGPEPKGGEFWLCGGRLVPVTQNDDFAIMALCKPEAFGLTNDDIVAFARKDGFAEFFMRQYQSYQERRDPHCWSSLGCRQIGMGLLFQRGWGLIRFEPTTRIGIQCAPAHAKMVLEAAGQKFSLLQIDRLEIALVDKAFEPSKRQTIRFEKEDFPGFAGPFGGAMTWIKTGKVPEQNWIYTVVDSPEAVRHGLHAPQRRSVTHGNWTEPNVYAINFYLRGMVDTRRFAPAGTMVRFPASAVEGVKHTHHEYERCYILYGKTPFSVPADLLQVKTAGGWAPVAD